MDLEQNALRYSFFFGFVLREFIVIFVHWINLRRNQLNYKLYNITSWPHLYTGTLFCVMIIHEGYQVSMNVYNVSDQLLGDHSIDPYNYLYSL